MEDPHRTHKEVPFGWLASLGGLLRPRRAAAPRSSWRKSRPALG